MWWGRYMDTRKSNHFTLACDTYLMTGCWLAMAPQYRTTCTSLHALYYPCLWWEAEYEGATVNIGTQLRNYFGFCFIMGIYVYQYGFFTTHAMVCVIYQQYRSWYQLTFLSSHPIIVCCVSISMVTWWPLAVQTAAWDCGGCQLESALPVYVDTVWVCELIHVSVVCVRHAVSMSQGHTDVSTN